MNREADVSQQSLQIPTYKAFIYIYIYSRLQYGSTPCPSRSLYVSTQKIMLNVPLQSNWDELQHERNQELPEDNQEKSIWCQNLGPLHDYSDKYKALTHKQQVWTKALLLFPLLRPGHQKAQKPKKHCLDGEKWWMRGSSRLSGSETWSPCKL